jgi:hypothetical protein
MLYEGYMEKRNKLVFGETLFGKMLFATSLDLQALSQKLINNRSISVHERRKCIIFCNVVS